MHDNSERYLEFVNSTTLYCIPALWYALGTQQWTDQIRIIPNRIDILVRNSTSKALQRQRWKFNHDYHWKH